MKLRRFIARNRNLAQEQKLSNPVYLQVKHAIDSVTKYLTNLPQDKKLVIYDFGCGQKPYAVYVPQHKYIGIDIDLNNDQADVYCDVTDVNLESNTADIALSFYVIEHVDSPQKMLNEKYRTLKAGGELYMLSPLYWPEHEAPYDYWRFTKFGLTKLLENSGFSNIEFEVVNSTPAIIGININSLLNRRFLRLLIPIVNFIFDQLQIRENQKHLANGTSSNNAMTYAIKATKSN
ncbi:class I SAM-dependent methyltransferase [Vibrio sp. M260118]|uniref:class I SAM-dependent methyltransferase n=1 Tax=Vibrio sp. M260118 TaxID=3020896 RepID=UPI002F400EE6